MSKRILANTIWSAATIGVLYWMNLWVIQLSATNRDFSFYSRVLMLCCINVTMAVSLNLINGINGQFSLGHAGFQAIGAYLSAGFSIHFGMKWFPGAESSPIYGAVVLSIAMVVGAVTAAIAGYVVGLPSLRLRGDYLAIVTLGFGEIIRVVFTNAEVFNAQRGLGGIPQLTTFFWAALVAVACIACSRNLLKSAHGLAFLAVREDEVAAAAMGVNPTKYKVTAFVIGTMFAGIAGALTSHYEGFVEPDSFKMDVSIMAVTMVVLGGQGSLTGSTVAAVGLTVLLEMLRFLPKVQIGSREMALADLRFVIFALSLILTMLFRPQGIFGHRELSVQLLRRWFGGRRAAEGT